MRMLWEIVKIVQVGVRNHCQYAKSGHLVLALSCCLLRQARRELARNANVRRGHGEFGAFAQVLVEMLSEIRSFLEFCRQRKLHLTNAQQVRYKVKPLNRKIATVYRHTIPPLNTPFLNVVQDWHLKHQTLPLSRSN